MVVLAVYKSTCSELIYCSGLIPLHLRWGPEKCLAWLEDTSTCPRGISADPSSCSLLLHLPHQSSPTLRIDLWWWWWEMKTLQGAPVGQTRQEIVLHTWIQFSGF